MGDPRISFAMTDTTNVRPALTETRNVSTSPDFESRPATEHGICNSVASSSVWFGSTSSFGAVGSINNGTSADAESASKARTQTIPGGASAATSTFNLPESFSARIETSSRSTMSSTGHLGNLPSA